MRVLLTTSDLSQAALFAAAQREGVTCIVNLTGARTVSPVLAAITRTCTRQTERATLHREIGCAAESACVLVLIQAADLERVRQIIANHRPTAKIDQLIGVSHA